jgi:hypothetical protein
VKPIDGYNKNSYLFCLPICIRGMQSIISLVEPSPMHTPFEHSTNLMELLLLVDLVAERWIGVILEVGFEGVSLWGWVEIIQEAEGEA